MAREALRVLPSIRLYLSRGFVLIEPLVPSVIWNGVYGPYGVLCYRTGFCFGKSPSRKMTKNGQKCSYNRVFGRF